LSQQQQQQQVLEPYTQTSSSSGTSCWNLLSKYTK
jgi:hypothetical protein